MRGTCGWIVAESSILFYRHFCDILGENHVIFFHTFWRENHVIFFSHILARNHVNFFYMHGAVLEQDVGLLRTETASCVSLVEKWGDEHT